MFAGSVVGKPESRFAERGEKCERFVRGVLSWGARAQIRLGKSLVVYGNTDL
jgi:hypothetical protein